MYLDDTLTEQELADANTELQSLDRHSPEAALRVLRHKLALWASELGQDDFC